MEIKVKKEKEPELKLKKEAQVTVHKKNPILSAKEKKAAFTSKPVADLLGQRKKKGNSRGRAEKRCLKNKRKRKSRPGKRQQSGELQKIENKMERPKVPYLYREPYSRIR